MKIVRFVMFQFLVISVFLSVASSISAQTVASPTPCITQLPGGPTTTCIMVNQRELGFRVPNLSDVMTFAIRMVFVIGGLAALFFLLLGAIAWITSGGDKDAVSKAQAKIQAAIIGVIMIAVVLALVVTLEQIVFARKICLGLSCPITLPSLLGPPTSPPENVEVVPGTVTTTPTVITATPDPNVTIVPGETNHPYPSNAIVVTTTPEPTLVPK